METVRSYQPATSPSVAVIVEIPPGLLKHYRQAFVPTHYPPFAVQTIAQQKARKWRTVNQPDAYLTEGRLTAHLKGHYWVAPVPKVFTRSLVVDIDKGQSQSVERRAEKVRRAFPEADPLTFSTPRTGLHLLFMLETPCWSDQVAQFGKERLEEAGIEVAPGKIEVYPNGGRAIRAPLGRDCRLLDPQTLEPMTWDREGDLWVLDKTLAEGGYDRLVIPADYGAAEVPVEPTKRRLRRGNGEFMQEVDQLLRFGLTGPGQRNAAFLKICWYFHVVQRLTGAQVEAELWAWIQDHHNGHSRDFTRNPQAVYQRVLGVVRAFKSEKVGTGKAGQKKAGNSSQRSVALRGAGNNMEVLIEAYLDSLFLAERERRFLGQVLLLAHRRGQEYLDGAALEVEIPSRTLKTFDRRYGAILPQLEAQGSMFRSRNYGAQIGRCSTYQVVCLDRENRGVWKRGVPHCS